jgi:hypothetical protein
MDQMTPNKEINMTSFAPESEDTGLFGKKLRAHCIAKLRAGQPLTEHEALAIHYWLDLLTDIEEDKQKINKEAQR